MRERFVALFIVFAFVGVTGGAADTQAGFTGVKWGDPALLSVGGGTPTQSSSLGLDPLVTSIDSWGLRGAAAARFGSRAEDAWRNGYTGSSEVVVAVIDSGLDVTHQDLAANVWVNPGEVINGLDDDSNGYVDDVHGWSFVKSSPDVSHVGGDGHGTHVAGTIGAVGGNGLGTSGVAPNVRIVALQVAFPDPQTGTPEEFEKSAGDVIKAFDYVTNLKKSGVNVAAINASIITNGYLSYDMTRAINRAGDQNILVVGATGNDGFLSGIQDPANTLCTHRTRKVNCMVAVTAHYPFGALPSWANRDRSRTALSAPGTGILSTEPGGRYGVRSGTSMAAPHATGAVALCVALEPDISLADKRALLLESTTPSPDLAGVINGGVLNVDEYTAKCGPHRIPTLSPLTLTEGLTTSSIFPVHGRATGVNVTATGLPPGVAVTPNGLLTGRPTRYGVYPVTVTAGSDSGNAVRSTTFTVRVYEDVPTNSFFEAATHWMKREGITQGVAPGVYGADRTVTRAEVAVLLWRAAGSPTAPNRVFSDEATIPGWARAATDWMWANGITVPASFRPSGAVTRAEAAAFLWRAAGRPT
jgi:subtilisin family serine protease